MMAVSLLGWLILALAGIGSLYTLAAARTVRRFFGGAVAAPARAEAVTILKPLYGDEPRLLDNLATFLAQNHKGPVQLLCGVQRADDPAIAVVERLRAACPAARIDLVVDATPHGANRKIANLINMARSIAHPIVVLSDSDIAVKPDYLSQLLATLDEPQVGAVTCVYSGRGDAGPWSQLAAAMLSYHFLPNATFATARGQMGDACMGSTIALHRDTLEAIGGFAAFADILADDHAIGRAVRAQGLRVMVPPMLVTHGSDDTRLGQLWRHELRWAATVRDITPAVSYLGLVITFPLPLAGLGALIHPLAGVVLIALATLSRLVLVGRIDALTGTQTAPKSFLLARDFLSLAVFIASYGVRSVDWRGMRLTMETDGRIVPETESLRR